MDLQTAALIAAVVFALVAIAGFQRYKRVKTGIKGPGGSGFEFTGSGDGEPAARPGVKVARARARTGDVVVEGAGGGVEASDLDAGRTTHISNVPAGDPKARPPV